VLVAAHSANLTGVSFMLEKRLRRRQWGQKSAESSRRSGAESKQNTVSV